MKIHRKYGLLSVLCLQLLVQSSSVYIAYVKNNDTDAYLSGSCPNDDEGASSNCNLRSAIKKCGDEGHKSCIINIQSYLHFNVSERITYSTISNEDTNLTINGNQAVATGNHKENTQFLYVSGNSTSFTIQDIKLKGFGDYLNDCEQYPCALKGAQDGGALHFDGVLTVNLNNVILEGNMGMGSMQIVNMLDTDTYADTNKVNIRGCEFINNTGASGGIYFQENVKGVLIEDTKFVDNSGLHGGAIFFKSNNDDLVIRNCEFHDNYAARSRIKGTNLDNNITLNNFHGGAIAFNFYTKNVVIEDSIFQGNFMGQGGALSFINGITDAFFRNVTFLNNTADNINRIGGGAISIANKCSNFTFVDCNFVDNEALGIGGGALAIGYRNKNIFIRGTRFEGNVGAINGGALFINNQNENVEMSDCNFSENSAKYGGGLYIHRDNSELIIRKSDFSNNSAVNGGGLHSYEDNNEVFIVDVNVTANYAYNNGGGIYFGRNLTNHFLISSQSYEFVNDSIESLHFDAVTTEINYKKTWLYDAPTGADRVIITFDSRSFLFVKSFVRIYTSDPDPVANAGDLIFECNGLSPAWPGIELPALHTQHTSLYFQFGSLSGDDYTEPTSNTTFYGFKLRILPLFSQNGDGDGFASKIVNNYATKGGGIHTQYQSKNLVISNALFNNNTAESFGSAIDFDLANAGSLVFSSALQDNTCLHGGGAIRFNSGNYGARVVKVAFLRNKGHLWGGGMFVSSSNGIGLYESGNEISSENCTFKSNFAIHGGALYIARWNKVNMTGAEFRQNSASLDGGGINVALDNNLHMLNSEIDGNSAGGNGGGIYSHQTNKVHIRLCDFRNNHAADLGGGIVIKGGSTFEFDSEGNANGIYIFNNTADYGGGIGIAHASMWSLRGGNNSKIVFAENTGNRGSAVAFASMTPSSKLLQSVTFLNNRAYQAGTVFWIYDKTQNRQPLEQDSSTIKWINNTAPYGKLYATQPMEARTSETYEMTVFNSPAWPSVNITLHDFYGAHALSSHENYLANIDILGGDCGTNYQPVIVGGGQAREINGTHSFKNLRIDCSPQGVVPIEYQIVPTAGSTLFGIDVTFKTNSTINFRDCRPGERKLGPHCLECDEGTYLLEYDPSVEVCDKCPPEAVYCKGNQIQLLPGYWRRYNTTKTILSCPYVDNGCEGGYNSGEVSCAEGHEGPLCAVCSDGYYYTVDKGGCVDCEGINLFHPTFAVGLVAMFVLLMFITCRLYQRFTRTITGEANNYDTYIEGNNDKDYSNYMEWDDDLSMSDVEDHYHTPRGKIFDTWLKHRFRGFVAKIKILIATFQIVGAAGESFLILFPTTFTRLFSALKFVNFNLIEILPFNCVYNTDFVDVLILTTVAPILISCLIFIIFVVELFVTKHSVDANKTLSVDERLEKIRSAYYEAKTRYFGLFVLLTYAVLPSVTTTIFSTYQCMNIDPENQDTASEDYFMIADYEISCSSDRYNFGVIWASIFILVYPIGVPIGYLLLLYNKKDEISHRQMMIKLPKAVSMLDFLYGSYKPEYWFWEVIETLRRLTLTAIISVIAQGSSIQIICSMMLSFIFLIVYDKFQPYKEHESEALAELAQYVVFFTFFGALIVSKDLLGNNSGSLIDVLLVILNVSTLWLTLYFEFGIVGQADTEEKEHNNKVFNDDSLERANSDVNSRATARKSRRETRKSLHEAEESRRKEKARASMRESLRREQQKEIQLLGVKIVPKQKEGTESNSNTKFARAKSTNAFGFNDNDENSFSYENIYKPQLSMMRENKKNTTHSTKPNSRTRELSPTEIENTIKLRLSPAQHSQNDTPSFISPRNGTRTIDKTVEMKQREHKEAELRSNSARELLNNHISYKVEENTSQVEKQQQANEHQQQQLPQRQDHRRDKGLQKSKYLQRQPQLLARGQLDSRQTTSTVQRATTDQIQKGLKGHETVGVEVSASMEELQEQKIMAHSKLRRNMISFNRQQEKGNYL